MPNNINTIIRSKNNEVPDVNVLKIGTGKRGEKGDRSKQGQIHKLFGGTTTSW